MNERTWMIEVEWMGDVLMCKIVDLPIDERLQHNDKLVWGIVRAVDKESALDKVTEYMVANG